MPIDLEKFKAEAPAKTENRRGRHSPAGAGLTQVPSESVEAAGLPGCCFG